MILNSFLWLFMNWQMLKLLSILIILTTLSQTEELATMNSLHLKTTGKNVLKDVNKILIPYNMKWNLLRCFKTNGSKNVNRTENAYEKILKVCDNAKCLKPAIIHQQGFAENTLIYCVVLNQRWWQQISFTLWANKHHWFHEFLLEIKAEYSDLP